MNIGMLWFDNDPKTDIETKLAKAALYYERKYGLSPDLCFVHPSMIKELNVKSKKIDIRESKSVLPNHFWLGIHSPSHSQI